MEQSDITQIGLSDANHKAIQRLKDEGYFDEMRDAYRFAIAFAISQHAKPEQLTRRDNMYSVLSIDETGVLVSAIRLLYPEAAHPHRLMEMLADWGMTELERLRAAGRIDIAEVLRTSEEAARNRVG